MIKKIENIEKEQLEKIVENSYSYNQVRKYFNLSSSVQTRQQLCYKIKNLNISTEHFWRERKNYIKKDDLIKFVSESFSMSQVFEKMGLCKYGGGNYRQFKKWKERYDLNTDHFTGKLTNKGKTGIIRNKYKLEEILVENSPYQGSSSSLKRRLLKENILENKCYECGIFEWRNKKLIIQIEHKNGNSSDNRVENLIMLCPNCHSQTITYCGRKNKRGSDVTAAMTDLESVVRKNVGVQVSPAPLNFCLCGKKIATGSKQCKECYHTSTRGIERIDTRKIKNRPLKDSLLEDLKIMNYCEVGRKYGVSDNTIRKWLK